MIPDGKKTVFVLGAGASIPYGYPSGVSLLKQLARLNPNHIPFRAAQQLGFSRDDISRFTSLLQQSAPPSIDHFLERRTEYDRLGKILIAGLLLESESKSIGIIPSLLAEEEHWCSKVFDKLCTPSFESLSFKNLKVITFNYDKSLEHCFFSMLKSRYSKSEQDMSLKIKELEIQHIYGTIGDLDWEEATGRPYGEGTVQFDSPEGTNLVRKVSEGIRVISNVRDGDETNQVLQKCCEWLNDANRIILLGMAYHQENMERLGFPLSSKPSRTVIEGSGFGLTELEKEHFEGSFGISIGATDHTNGRFLRHCRNFISL